MHGLTGHDAGSLELQGAPAFGGDLAQAVDRAAQRVDDASQVAVAYRHGQDLSGAADHLALVDAGEVAQDDDADLALVQVHRQSRGAVLEGQQLVGHDAGQAFDVGDAVRGEDDVTDLLGSHLGGLVGLDELVERGADLLRPDGQVSHLSSPCGWWNRSKDRDVWCGRRQDARAARRSWMEELTVESMTTFPTVTLAPPTTAGSTIVLSSTSLPSLRCRTAMRRPSC